MGNRTSHRPSLAPWRLLLRRLCFAGLLFLAVACVQAGEPPAGEGDADGSEQAVLELVPGTVTQVGNFGFGLVPDSDPGTRYAPTEPLAESFQQDGLRVRFSGVVGDPDEGGGRGGRGGRRWGTPLEVTHIEILDEDAPEEDPETGRTEP